MAPPPLTPTYHLYRGLTFLAAPLFGRAARRRMQAANGPMERLPERMGRASLSRPEGRLVWLHAVSVGEFLSVLALIGDLRGQGVQVLVTTTTSTAAELAARRLPEGAIHQFSPIDTPQAARRFLDHWTPDLAIFVESEIWPNQIVACRTRGIPVALINARLSARSLAGWHKRPKTARALLGRFECIMCQMDETRQALEALGAPAARISTTGDMKAAAPALPYDAAETDRLSTVLAGRPVWVASSTHPGEEEVMIAAHQIVTAQRDRALMILVPRHPERGDAIEAMLKAEGWNMARRSRGDEVGPDTKIYLADTLGETGLWYQLAPIVCVAGSFVPVGGHNPYEPAHFDCAILHGPLYANFTLAYGDMAQRDAAIEVADANGLGRTVAELFGSPRLSALQDNAAAYVRSATDIREKVVEKLLSLMG